MTRWTQTDVDTFLKRQGRRIEKAPPIPRERSDLEVQFEMQLIANDYRGYVLQHKPLLPRRWSLDFAWPETKIAVEVQGMVHRIKGKFKRDIEKRAELMLAGWRVLEIDGDSIRDGRAIAWIRRLLA